MFSFDVNVAKSAAIPTAPITTGAAKATMRLVEPVTDLPSSIAFAKGEMRRRNGRPMSKPPRSTLPTIWHATIWPRTVNATKKTCSRHSR